MLAFIIPLKPNTGSNWKFECINLNQTLKSICNQDIDTFKVYVIYTDYPDIEYSSPFVEFVKFPFEIFSTEYINTVEKKSNSSFNDEIDYKVYDQGKRLLFGSFIARTNGFKFVMPVDADDFISNKLARWVHNHIDEKYGWFIDKGFIKYKNSKILIRVKKGMNNINCSTHILNTDLLPKENINDLLPSMICFFASHGYLQERIRISHGAILKPIPFYALIYYIHGYNWMGVESFASKNRFKVLIKYILRGMLINKEINAEFGILN
jgi:hypothetical protein